MIENYEVLHRDKAIILDLNNRENVYDIIKTSLKKQGFIIVTNHNIDNDLLDNAYKLSTDFFKLKDEIKNKYHFSLIDQKKYSDVGFFPFKTEKALGVNFPDLKEMFHIGQNYSQNQGVQNLFAKNKFPIEIINFQYHFQELFEKFQKLGDTLISLIWESYYSNVEYINDLVESGNSLLRLLHYPIVNDIDESMRAAPHTGIQLLGLQPRTSHPGLQFFTPEGKWISPSDNFRDCIFINIGDMMEYLLNNEVKATLHKVVNSENNSNLYDRYAIVHFYHANPLKTLYKKGLIDESNSVNSGDWLIKRLIEIGVIIH